MNQTGGHLNAYADTQHKITAASHPQTNGLPECMNHTLMNVLEKIDDAETERESHIKAILFAYRTIKHHSTRFTPFNLMFRREARLPIDLAVISRPGATCAYPATNSFESKLQHLQRMRKKSGRLRRRTLQKRINGRREALTKDTMPQLCT